MDMVFDFRKELPEADDIPITYMGFPYTMHAACMHQHIDYLSQFEGVDSGRLTGTRGMGPARWKQCVEILRDFHFEMDSTGTFHYTGSPEPQPCTPLPPELDLPIDVLKLGRVAYSRFTKRMGMAMISDFVGMSYCELTHLSSIGSPTVAQILAELKKYGIGFPSGEPIPYNARLTYLGAGR